jgi:hypothetical protein
MVRITYRGADGRTGVALSDRRARTPQEAIRNAIRAKRSSTRRVRIEGMSAFPYVVLR